MRYLRYRLGQACIVIALIVTGTFFVMRITAGDPARIQAQIFTQQNVIDQYKKEFGTNRTLPAQFASFLNGLLHGSLGTSFRYRQPVVHLLAQALPATMLLAAVSLALALIVVLTLGTAAGRRPGHMADRIATSLTVFGQSAPLFWTGLMLVFLFALRLRWLPAGGLAGWTSLVLPAIAIALTIIPTELRIFTTSMRAELSEDYIRTARAYGIPDWRITYLYAGRNAVLPLLTVVGVDMGYLLGGTIVAEAVFNYPGLGNLALAAFTARDYPLIQGITMVSASLFVLLNVVVDIVYMVVNPRIRLAA